MGNGVSIDITAQDQTQAVLSRIEQSVAGFGNKVGGIFKMISVGAAGLFAFDKVAGAIGGFISSSMEAEEAGAKLEAVLKTTGGACGYSSEQLQQFATDLQSVTKFEGDATAAAMGVLATFKNIKGDEFLDATKAAQDMATVMGTDLNGAMVQLGKALNDPLQGMSALSRVGVSFTDQQKEQIKAMQEAGDMAGAQRVILAELQGEFGGAAEAAGATFGGQVEILKNRLGDLSEAIGSALTPYMEILVGYAADLTTWFESNVGWIQEWIASGVEMAKVVGDWIVGALKDLMSVGIAAFTGLELLVTNWRDALELAWVSIKYSAVAAFNTIAYFVTDVLPQYFTWFVDNATNIFQTYFNFVSTLFINMGKNIADFFVSVWKWLKGEDADWKWTGLLEGFENTIKELPTIAARIPGALEKELGGQMSRLGGKLGGQFQDKLQERLVAFGLVDGVTAPGAGAKPKVDMKPKLEGAAGEYSGTGPRGEEKKQKEDKGQAASFEGLSDLYKRIASAAGGRGTPEERTAKATEKAAEDQKETAKAAVAQKGTLEKIYSLLEGLTKSDFVARMG